MEASAIVRTVRERAAELLASGRVDLVIGFEQGSMPMRAAPCFVSDADGTDRLVWNSFCGVNLARFLRGRHGRIAVVAKACDTRALVELIKENQLCRTDMVVIGVPCAGMVDSAAVEEITGHAGITGVEEADGRLLLTAGGSPVSLPREDVLCRSCRRCSTRNPVICDIAVGERAPEPEIPGFLDVDQFAALPSEERRTRIEAEMKRCIRCNACRNVCPMCYCVRCFADDAFPQWVGRGGDPGSVMSFHLVRALHLAGRCVECGACERACPTGVDLGILNRRMSADVYRHFGYRPGMAPEIPSPLSTFSPGDPEDFMLEPDRGRSCGCGG
ncbi:4Fe-4S ferredoxin [Candidatus Fermentibacteria bacterium]|nr:4Fe-4S ferredoxin [Candidatus Fermentibacteria bacterium]